MLVRDLKAQLEEFRNELSAHRDLWRVSLGQPIPDFPVRDIDQLAAQMSSLARKLGRLRQFINRFASATELELPALGTSWNIFDSAVGNDVCQRKSHSLEAAIQQIDQILGHLDGMNEAENALQPEPRNELSASTTSEPQPTSHSTPDRSTPDQIPDTFEHKYELLKALVLGILGIVVAVLIGVIWEYAVRRYQWRWFSDDLSVRLLSYFALLSLVEGLLVRQIRRHWQVWLGSIVVPCVIAIFQSLRPR